MNRKDETTVPMKPSRTRLASLLGATTVVVVLLYWELPGLLYVLSTVAMCALFIVAAFSNLEKGTSEIGGNEG